MRGIEQHRLPPIVAGWGRHSCLSIGRRDIAVPSFFVLTVLMLFMAPATQAAPTLSLPTDGHYRPGRYMPIRIEGAARDNPIIVSGNGAIPSEIEHPQSADFVMPWLIASDYVTDARWQVSGGQAHPLTLHPLGSDERLVGFAGPQQDFARLLFPGSAIVPVQLDESRLLEPVEAWECLDAVVLSASAAARLDEVHRAALLAGGTLIAIRSDRAPDDHWAWQRRGGYWVLQYAPAGPRSIIEPDAYAPTYSWDRGWPTDIRRRVVWAAVIFCIFMLATLLWRSRWTPLAILSLSLLSLAGLAIWYSRQSPVLQLSTAIRVEDGSISQFDLWNWQSPVRAADASFRVSGITHPVIATLKQIEQTRLRLMCQPDGRPDQFDVHLDAMQSIAFLSRQLRLSAGLPALTEAPRASGSFADALYLRPGDQIQGQYFAHGVGAPVPVLVIVATRR